MSKGYESKMREYLRDYMKVAREVKAIILEIDPNARVYVFGSVVKGRYTASSDIDILVITDKIEERDRMRVRVYKLVEAPVELHLATPETFNNWYRRFLRDEEIVEVT